MKRMISAATNMDQLEYYCRILNDLTGHEEGSVGAYTISGAYGKVCLEKFNNENGGVRTVSGYCTKPQLLQILDSIINVLEFEK